MGDCVFPVLTAYQPCSLLQERRAQLAAGELQERDLLDMLLLARDEEGRAMTGAGPARWAESSAHGVCALQT